VPQTDFDCALLAHRAGEPASSSLFANEEACSLIAPPLAGARFATLAGRLMVRIAPEAGYPQISAC
jgi:hypothetical protein